MRLLLDSHTFLWAIWDPSRLSARVAQLLADPGVVRYVSAVSLWELGIKAQSGKLQFLGPPGFYRRHLASLQAQFLGLEIDHIEALAGLPLHHRDPFDRMLIAQARSEGLVLVSRDEAFEAYDVDCMWQ